MVDIHKIAAEADVIIDGYAFLQMESGYRVMNLNMPDKVTVFALDGNVLETTMNDIELHIAQKHLNRGYMIIIVKDHLILLHYTPNKRKREDLRKFSLFFSHLSQSLLDLSVQFAEIGLDILSFLKIGSRIKATIGNKKGRIFDHEETVCFVSCCDYGGQFCCM